MITAPKPPHPALEDLQAIDAMLTAARSHACAIADATTPGTTLRGRALTLMRRLELAHSDCTFLAIDVDPTQRIPAPPQLSPPATAAAA